MTVVTVPDGVDESAAWHYGEPTREQRWIEDATGIVDLSHRDVVHITGADRLTLLHALTTADVASMSAGDTARAYILDAHGRIQHYVAFQETGGDTWGWTEPGRGRALVDHLMAMKFRWDAQARIEPDMAVVWVGDQGLKPTGRVAVGAQAAIPSLTGADLIVVKSDVPRYSPNVGVWAWEACRIAAGIPRFGVDFDETTIPNELGVPSTEVSTDKGCYPGQEVVAKVLKAGSPRRRLARLSLDGVAEAGEGLPGHIVRADGGDVGVLGSVAYHHERGLIGLALLKGTVEDGATVDVAGVPACVEFLVKATERPVMKRDGFLPRHVGPSLMG